MPLNVACRAKIPQAQFFRCWPIEFAAAARPPVKTTVGGLNCYKKTPAPITRVAGPAGRIVPAYLSWQNASGQGRLLGDIDGCLPIGEGIDLVWHRGNLFLMKEKGRLKPVWSADGQYDHFRPLQPGGTTVCFDGRYVWAVLHRLKQEPLLIVLDPRTEKTWTLGAEDGVPVRSGGPLAPVEPGKICVVYSKGPATRFGIVGFAPDAGGSVKLLSSSPPAAENTPLAGGLPDRSILAFLNLSPPAPPGAKPLRRLALCPVSGAGSLAGPLLIDPETFAFETASNSALTGPLNNSRIASLNGALYWVGRSPTEGKAVLARAALPQFHEEWLFDDMPEAKPVVYGGRLAFLGESCWLWKPGEKNLAAIDVKVPWSYKSELALASPPARKIAEEEWELREVYASENYGALAKAVKRTGPNSYAMTYLFFQFALEDDPRIAPESPPGEKPPGWVDRLAAGTAASELALYAASGERPAKASMGKVHEAPVDDAFRYPILAREIVRQAWLIAARDQLQWATRDEALRENLQRDDEHAARFALSMRFPYAGQAEFNLRSLADETNADALWQERVKLYEAEGGPLDYAHLVEEAERWSRESFPALLKRSGLSGQPVSFSDDAKVSAEVGEWLKEMSFVGQFAAIRDLHRVIRAGGESDELLGALVQAYANLGVLTEFHFNAMHKACKARALLYAQRMVARKPQSPQALWRRAYAKALLGLSDSAITDLNAAKAHAAASAIDERPRWVEIIEAYSRFDGDKLSALSEEKDYAQLAGLLRFFLVERLKESAAVQTLAQRLVERDPADFRLLDALCDSCAIGTLHTITQLAPAMLQERLPPRMRQLQEVPAGTREILDRDTPNADLGDVAESLLQTPAEDDAGEFSWRVLGRMVREVEFVQLWRRVQFMRFQWSVPTDDFIAAVQGMASKHPYRPLIELCSTDANRRQTAAETLVARLDMEEIDFAQQRAFERAMGDLWQARWTERYAQAKQRVALHCDDIRRDLWARTDRDGWLAPGELLGRLSRIDSGNPDVVAAKFLEERKPSPETRAMLEERFARSPQIWKALAASPASADEQKRALRKYIELSPDAWAYQKLAKILRDEGKMDQWKAMLDECLRQPDFGLEHVKVRVDIATYHMDHDEWEQARPYAEEAAESWAEWAMLSAIRCYRGLQDDKREGEWRERIVERYPKTGHLLDLYAWSRRTGLGDSARYFRELQPMIAAAVEGTNAESQYMIGLFYQLGKRPREARAAYQKGADGHLPARQACFDNLWVAVLSQELGETEARDGALARVERLKDPAVASFRELAKWMRESAALPSDARPDRDAARRIAASAEANDRTGIHCFVGRTLELRGHREDAVEFYRAAVAEPAGRFSATYAWVCAALRDRGLDPRSKQ